MSLARFSFQFVRPDRRTFDAICYSKAMHQQDFKHDYQRCVDASIQTESPSSHDSYYSAIIGHAHVLHDWAQLYCKSFALTLT